MSRRGHVTRDAESGLWGFVVDVAPLGAKRRQVRRRGFRTKRLAQESLTDLLGETRRGEFIEPNRIKVGEYFETWCEGLASGDRMRASTIDSYTRNVRLHVKPLIGDGRLQALTATDLDRLYAALLISGLSARTVRYVATIVQRALGDGVRKGILVRNVAIEADPPAASAARAPEMQTWTPSQLRQFLGAVAGHRLYPLLRTVGMTGMRRGELLGLRWPDVELSDSAGITVRRQLAGVDKDGSPVFEEPKTAAGRRSIDVDAETAAVLREHRRAQLEERLLIGEGWRDHDLVFCGPAGEPLHGDALSKVFLRLSASAKLPRIRFHDLRHSHATHLLAAGVPAHVVSARLGHTNVGFTLSTYAHVLPMQQASAAAAVATLVDGDR